MTVRMFHPQHGWTHAYSEREVKELEKLGWKVEESPKGRKSKEKK